MSLGKRRYQVILAYIVYKQSVHESCIQFSHVDVAEKAFSKCVETNEGKQGQKEVHAIDHNFRVCYDYEFLEDFQESHSSDTENRYSDL